MSSLETYKDTITDLQSYCVVKEAYQTLLQIPHQNALRWKAQRVLSALRDFIADIEGRSSQEVQEEYEQKVRMEV